MTDSNTPSPPLNELLSEARWLRDLARRLVSSDSAADDLVQETWVRALGRPPRRPGPVRGWLAQVMRRASHDTRRQAAARERREAQVRPADAASSTDDVVERAELQRVLVEELLALGESYSRPLLLRYFDGLEPSEVAARLGMTASGARTREQRGLEQLRERLERRHGDRDWRLALLPLALPRPGRGTAFVGSFKSVLALASVVVVTAALVWFAGGAEPGTVDPAPRVAAGEPAVSETNPDPQSGDLPAANRSSIGRAGIDPTSGFDPTSSSGGAPSAAPPTAPASLEILLLFDEEPAPTGTVTLYPEGTWNTPRDAEPRFSLEVVEGRASLTEGRFEQGAIRAVSGNHSSWTRGAHPHTEGALLTIYLGSGRVEGRVLDAEGEPAVGVELFLGQRRGHNYGAVSRRTTTEGRGEYRFESIPPGDFWVHATLEGEELRSHGSLRRGELRRVELGGPRVTLSVRLRNRAGDDVPSEGSEVEFHREADGERAVFPARPGEDGVLGVALAPGSYRVRGRSGTYREWATLAERLEVEGASELELVLPGTRISGTVRRPGTGLVHDPEVDGELRVYLQVEAGGRTTRHRTRVGSDGRYAIDGVPPGRFVLCGQDLIPRDVVVTSADLGIELDLALEGE